MSCQHLVCAQCAHPVVEGRCALCRANRERLHGHHFAGLSPSMIVIVLLVALFATLMLDHLLGF